MPKALPDIIYDKSNITPIVDAKTSFYKIPFFKDSEYFSNYESYVNFVKGIEKMVRTNDKYRKYINYLKNEVKLNKCQVLKNVTDEDCEIEMHHGPILTLFDICAIVTEYFLKKGWKTNTFRVAKQVLQDHHDNMVQVVMLSATIHQEVHAHNIFINYHQAWGDMNKFINKYRDAISDDYKYKINRYLDKCLLHDTNDNDVLTLSQNLFKNDVKK